MVIVIFLQNPFSFKSFHYCVVGPYLLQGFNFPPNKFLPWKRLLRSPKGVAGQRVLLPNPKTKEKRNLTVPARWEVVLARKLLLWTRSMFSGSHSLLSSMTGSLITTSFGLRSLAGIYASFLKVYLVSYTFLELLLFGFVAFEVLVMCSGLCWQWCSITLDLGFNNLCSLVCLYPKHSW